MTQPTFDPIDDAFQTYPLEAAPPTLAPGLLARLRALPAGVRPKFRMHWYDWAVSAFTTGMAGLGLVLWHSIPPQVLARWQVDWLILLQRLSYMVPNLPGLGS